MYKGGSRPQDSGKGDNLNPPPPPPSPPAPQTGQVAAYLPNLSPLMHDAGTRTHRTPDMPGT